MSTAASARLTVTSHAWQTPPRRPRMANDEDRRSGLALDSQALWRDGAPWIPVSGEIHYSRVPRARWAERLRQMKAGGITVVACYVPWIHHVPERGAPRFDDNLDVGAFLDLVQAEDLDVVVRIGPWAHGELRNGGYPDWVQAAPVRHRTDDPAYLTLVREWWGQLATALDGRVTPERVLGIQLENELYDQPGHIATLKGIARELGFAAPFWTATAWGGAQLPDPEVFPLFGGYGDGFWVDADAAWDPSFRDHFFFSHVWDDPGIGADLRTDDAGVARAGLSPWFPPATCEVGGGMATAYHRRPRPEPADIAAVAHGKLGNGSAWQGFYMYAGGTNPPGGLQESHATGYPNDLPPRSYDFHAPIGESGLLGASHAPLRRHAAFAEAFGARLGAMPSHLPDRRPTGIDDVETLRWAFRGDDDGGFLFVSWHQPFVPLADHPATQFEVSFPSGSVTLPDHPTAIPVGTRAQWPVGLEVGGVRVDWATASALTLLDGPVPTLVLVEDTGIAPGLSTGGVTHTLIPGRPLRIADAAGALDVLLIPAERADAVWVAGTGSARDLLLSDDELQWSDAATGGRVFSVRSPRDEPIVSRYEPTVGAFVDTRVDGAADGGRAALTWTTVRAAGDVSGEYGSFDGRPSAPGDDVVDAASAVFELSGLADADDDTWLHLEWIGDVARLLVDGDVVTDRFWDGAPWSINAGDAGIRPGSRVQVQVLPLLPGSRPHLPPSAAAERARLTGPTAALRSAALERRPRRTVTLAPLPSLLTERL